MKIGYPTSRRCTILNLRYNFRVLVTNSTEEKYRQNFYIYIHPIICLLQDTRTKYLHDVLSKLIGHHFPRANKRIPNSI